MAVEPKDEAEDDEEDEDEEAGRLLSGAWWAREAMGSSCFLLSVLLCSASALCGRELVSIITIHQPSNRKENQHRDRQKGREPQHASRTRGEDRGRPGPPRMLLDRDRQR